MISFEKGQLGCLFQISNELKTDKEEAMVITHRDGTKRKGVFLKDSSEHLETQLDSLSRIEKLLENLRVDSNYSVFNSNCQHAAASWQKGLVDASLNLKFHVPAKQQTITLNDETLVSVVEDMYPNWKLGAFQQFPEYSNPFAFETLENAPTENLDRDPDLRKAYTLLRNKQRILNAIKDLLAESHETWAIGKTAIISHLSKDKYEMALRMAQPDEVD